MRTDSLAQIAALALAWSLSGLHANAAACDQSLGFYQKNHYILKNIRLEAPFDVFQGLSRGVKLDQLPLQAEKIEQGVTVQKGEFDTVAYSFSVAAVRNQIYAGMDSSNRLNFVGVFPELQSCDDVQHTLDVTFRAYELALPTSLAKGFDASQQTLLKRFSQRDQSPLLPSLVPQLKTGYDSNRHLHAGGQFMYQAQPGGLFDAMSLEGSASTNSMTFQGSLKGSHNWAKAGIRHAEWALGYSSSDVPSNALQLSDSKATARFSAASRQLADKALVLYFGSAVEAGNQHASGVAASPADLLSSQVGSLKGYLGTALNAGHHLIKGSYGIQAAKSTTGVHVDYVKQIVNASDSVRLLPRDHHPLTIDAQVAAGWISGTGPTPLTERFFGGNSERDFIPQDFWKIQSNPMIRSFATNALDLASSTQTGGTSFFSLNTTVGYVVWGSPLIPANVIKDVEPPLLGQIKSGESALVNSYMGDLDAMKSLETGLFARRNEFASLRDKMNAIQEIPGISQEIIDQASSVNDDDLDNIDAEIQQLPNDHVDAVTAVLSLIVDTRPGSVEALASDVKDLADMLGKAGLATQQADVAARSDALRQLRQDFLTQFNRIDQTQPKAQAKAGMKFARSVLEEILHGLNLYSVAPVLLFDAARLGPQRGPILSGTRYGIGPAARFSLVNFDVTLGYSFNPNPRLGERRGAVVFAIGIGDIFR